MLESQRHRAAGRTLASHPRKPENRSPNQVEHPLDRRQNSEQSATAFRFALAPPKPGNERRVVSGKQSIELRRELAPDDRRVELDGADLFPLEVEGAGHTFASVGTRSDDELYAAGELGKKEAYPAIEKQCQGTD